MKAVKISKILGTLILGLLSAVSCIKEDTSNCPRNRYRLQFRFSCEDTRIVQNGELRVADVYVFDRNSRFVAVQQIVDPVVGKTYTADFSLAAGDYSFAVWVNKTGPYSTIPDSGDFGMVSLAKRDAEICLDVPEDRYIRSIIPELLYGSLDFETDPDQGEQLFTIPLEENTNIINLTVRGLAKTTHEYNYSITDDNGNYYFDNTFAPCGEFRYATTTRFGDSDELTSSLTVLRLAADRHPELTFSDSTTGKMIYPRGPGQTGDLISMILAAYADGPRIDFDKTHVYDIVISFDAHMAVSVSINGWELTPDEQEL